MWASSNTPRAAQWRNNEERENGKGRPTREGPRGRPGGTLSDRLLATQVARDWIRGMQQTFLF